MAVSHALTVIGFLEHARPPTKGARCVLIVQDGETQLHRQLTAYNVPNTVLLVIHVYIPVLMACAGIQAIIYVCLVALSDTLSCCLYSSARV